jgi:hypothetical protein
MARHTPEPAAQKIADATSKPPFLYELGPCGQASGTAALEQAIHVLRKALGTS